VRRSIGWPAEPGTSSTIFDTALSLISSRVSMSDDTMIYEMLD
jgi:hypothetical protein